MIKKLEKTVHEPWFTKEKMTSKSKAAAGLCAWVLAMYQFYFVNLQVIPKRKK